MEPQSRKPLYPGLYGVVLCGLWVGADSGEKLRSSSSAAAASAAQPRSLAVVGVAQALAANDEGGLASGWECLEMMGWLYHPGAKRTKTGIGWLCSGAWICNGVCDAKQGHAEDGSAMEGTAPKTSTCRGWPRKGTVSGEFTFTAFEEPAIKAVQLHIAFIAISFLSLQLQIMLRALLLSSLRPH